MTKLITWNVNGIRAVIKKDFLSWLDEEQPDILAIQETKAHPEQLTDEILKPKGYKTFWMSAEKKGYSGVALLTKKEPLSVQPLGVDEFDSEGRVLIAEYENFFLINGYFPNSQEAGKRLDYKLRYCNEILRKSNEYKRDGKCVIICGDLNIAHKPIDLANPKRNEGNPGYLPEERAWMDSFVSEGYVDAFRMFNQEPEQYTWWSYRFQARANNIGWRIDYFCINEEFSHYIQDATILNSVMGSDHCPVRITIK
ncbi:MAG: exodeoxyribonuclease III [Nitrospinae bacterium]|nr:exodeoxyribonuclease III [Nitrospinota bacterium]